MTGLTRGKYRGSNPTPPHQNLRRILRLFGKSSQIWGYRSWG